MGLNEEVCIGYDWLLVVDQVVEGDMSNMMVVIQDCELCVVVELVEFGFYCISVFNFVVQVLIYCLWFNDLEGVCSFFVSLILQQNVVLEKYVFFFSVCFLVK